MKAMSDHAAPEAHPLNESEIETPTGVIDVPKVVRNAERATRYCREHGLGWRPHVKTHKSTRVAEIQLTAGASGLTVATPREAEVMSAVCEDLLLAYPPVGDAKLKRLMGLPSTVDLKVALDSSDVLAGLSAASLEAGRSTGILVELDVGARRVGVSDPTEAVRLAAEVADAPGVHFRGILFYPGHIRTPSEDQDQALSGLREDLDGFVDALTTSGFAPEIVSGGSTPTMWRSHEIPHLTEVRAGTCIFNDRDIATLGSAGWDDCAYAVLATVVSIAVPDQAVVDAGSKALAKEIRGGSDSSYGFVVEHPDVSIRSLSEEHGVLDLSRTEWRPEVGDRVRVIPNHVCVSVNLQDHLIAVENGSWERWPLEGRGRGPT